MTTTWIAAHRIAVINPHEAFHLFEPRGFSDHTIRQSIRLAGCGEAPRLRLSNRYGKEPLDTDGAHLRARTHGSGIDPTSDTPLHFSGAETATIPVGEDITRDPAELPVSAGEELTLSLYLPGDTGPSTYSTVPYDTRHAAPGNQLSAELPDTTEELPTSHLLTAVDVLAPADTRIAVAFGDSCLLGTDQPFDTVIDIAAAVADPTAPDRIRPESNGGDGLHVNDAGAKAIADAVDLSLLNLQTLQKQPLWKQML